MSADLLENTGPAVIDRRYNAIFSHLPGTVFARGWLSKGVGCKTDCNGLVRGIYSIHAAPNISRDS
jgi:hypothetical protein